MPFRPRVRARGGKEPLREVSCLRQGRAACPRDGGVYRECVLLRRAAQDVSDRRDGPLLPRPSTARRRVPRGGRSNMVSILERGLSALHGGTCAAAGASPSSPPRDSIASERSRAGVRAALRASGRSLRGLQRVRQGGPELSRRDSSRSHRLPNRPRALDVSGDPAYLSNPRAQPGAAQGGQSCLEGLFRRDANWYEVLGELGAEGHRALVKIADFGISFRTADEERGYAVGTRPMLGTPRYIAPERGKGEYGGTRSDIFSLGIIAYELITGRAPFPGLKKRQVVEAYQSHPIRLPAEHVGKFPAGFGELFDGMTAIDPSRRWDAERVVPRSSRLQFDLAAVDGSPAGGFPQGVSCRGFSCRGSLAGDRLAGD